MRDQAILRVETPGGPAIPVRVARLLDPHSNKAVIDFTAIDDYAVYLELDAVTPETYRLAVEIADYPPLHFAVRIEGASERSFAFESPAPACATISVQQASAGPTTSRRMHVVYLALPPKFESVVLIAGADLKGSADYLVFAQSWRDDLYHGRTDLGPKPNQRITQGIFDHTIVSLFDFRTGVHEQQIKATRGWHSMDRRMLGTVPPYLVNPKHTLEQRQQADSISIVDVYEHMSELGRVRRGCVRQLHFFSHAYIRGPVLQNTSDNSDSELRDDTDKDPRTKDFLPANLAAYSSLRDAFDTNSYVKSWGCFGSELTSRLQAVARTKTLDEVVKYKGEPYTSADAIRELRQFVFPDAYMLAFCREFGVDGWALAPGTKSTYQTSPKYHYFRANPDVHGAVIGWYERNFDCKRDLSGAISYRKFLSP